MSSERKLVYRLDEGVALSGESKILSPVLGNGVFGRGTRTQDLFLSGCPQSIPTFEPSLDRAEWHREEHGDAGHRDLPPNPPASGGTQAQPTDGKVNQGSDPSGSSGLPEVNYPSERTSEPVLEREVQRGDDPVLHRSTGPCTCTSEDKVGREYGYTATGVLCDGRKHETVVARYVTKQRGRRWIFTALLDSQRGLQVPESSRPASNDDGGTAK